MRVEPISKSRPEAGASLRAGLLSLFGICFCGCPGTLEDPWRFQRDAQAEPGDAAESNDAESNDAACVDVPSAVFGTICATAGCHSAADKMQGLDLESPGVQSRLVGMCAQGGGLLIDPAEPSRSVLYEKLTPTPPFGARMPLGKAPLDAVTLACVLAWVSAQQGSVSDCNGGATADGSTE